MRCPKCGRDLPADAVLCCYCGRRLVRQARKTARRPNGSGSVYPRKNGWEAQVVVGFRPPKTEGGKPIPIKIRRLYPTKAEAVLGCAELLRGGGTRPSEAPRLSYYWDAYEKGEFDQLSHSKQVAYRIAWNKLAEIHSARVDTLTVQDLRRVVSAACPTYYPARDCKTVLSALFTLAGADGFADRSLPSYIVLPKLEEKERDAFTADEQAAIWRVYESGDRRAAIPLLMIYTGMMPGEAMALRVEHIDLAARTITGVGKKTAVRKKTPLVISETILPLVEDLMDHAQPSGYIWIHNEDRWRADYDAALAAAGTRRLTPYCCRHTTATALAITAHIAPQTIQRVMRWSTSKLLDRYAHPQTADALAAADALRRDATTAKADPASASPPSTDPSAAPPQPPAAP